MKTFSLFVLLVAASSFGCASNGAQHSHAQPTPQQMMEAMMRTGTPGAEHKALEPFVGSWNATVSWWMDPSMPPSESKGTMVNSWVYGGRYLEQKFVGDMDGQRFEGTGLWGFDIAAGKYIGTWYDSMSTSMSRSVGSISKDGKSFRMTAYNTDPVTGQESCGEELITLDGPNQHTMAMYEDRGGQKVMTMKIVYTRK